MLTVCACGISGNIPLVVCATTFIEAASYSATSPAIASRVRPSQTFLGRVNTSAPVAVLGLPSCARSRVSLRGPAGRDAVLHSVLSQATRLRSPRPPSSPAVHPGPWRRGRGRLAPTVIASIRSMGSAMTTATATATSRMGK